MQCRLLSSRCKVAFALSVAFLVAGFPAATQRRPVAPTTPEPAAPRKITSEGSFTDRTGKAHAWNITLSNALIWDGQPYLPVGGTFAPRSFQTDAEAAWQEDVAALTTLKGKGLLDILLWPGKPLPDISPTAFQRLVDYLETNGFRYGLAFGPGLSAPLTGTIVKPATYRFADTKESLTATWQVPNADTALFILTDLDDNNKIIPSRSGQVTVRDGIVTNSVEAPTTSGKVVAILYPHKALPYTGEGDLPDLWAGFDAYRDRLLAFLGKVKFGGGLRFFLDPLARHIGLLGESDFLVPDSQTFLLEWEGYLSRRYPNIEELRLAWALEGGDEYKTHQSLARLVPLWANSRGVPYFYDPVLHKPVRILEASQSRWWQDFLKFRNDSILYYLNATANILKHEVADIPVVVTWMHSHPIFSNTDPNGGFDGLGIVVKTHGTALVGRVAGPAYSGAQQAARTTWCLATEILGRPRATSAGSQATTAALPAGQDARPLIGYETRPALFNDLDAMQTVGLKGFFASGFQPAPGDANSGATDWLRAPETLDWLHDYAAKFDRGRATANYAPQILYFPQSAPGPAHIGPVPGARNVLWMESFASGEALDWWPSYRGYTIRTGDETNQTETVLVSLQGARATRLWVPDPKRVHAFTPDRTPILFKVADKNLIVVTLSETPTVFTTEGQPLVPVEAANDAIVQLSALLDIANARKVPTAPGEQFSLDRARLAFKQKDFETAYTFARASLDKLTQDAQPYIWIEGEEPYRGAHTFTEIAPNAEASGGAYLRLSTPNAPTRLPYGARYVFSVPADGKYNIWIAGTYPGPNTSPIKWRINTEPAQDPTDTATHGPLYLNERFGWFLLGSAELKKGDGQTLTIYVTDRAVSPPHYIFSIDSLLLTARDFKPNGTVRPLPVDAEAVRAYMKGKRSQ